MRFRKSGRRDADKAADGGLSEHSGKLLRMIHSFGVPTLSFERDHQQRTHPTESGAQGAPTYR